MPQSSHASMVFTLPPNDLGLVGHWTFDGPTVSTTTADDTSGSGNNVTLVNGPVPTMGKIGQALSFNGTNQYALRSSLSGALSSYLTTCTWVKTSSSAVHQIIWQLNRSPTNYYNEGVFELLDGKVEFYDYSNSGYGFPSDTTYAANTAVNDGAWHFICFVKDGVTGTYYTDGAPDGTTTAAVDVAYGTSDFAIGLDYRNMNNYFSGAMDGLRIYDTALSATQIQQLYNRGKVTLGGASDTALTGGLVGHWSFNGSTISGTTVNDVSGNGNNGTMVAGPTPTIGKMGQGLAFNGTNQYVTMAGGSPPSMTSPWSLSAWVKNNAPSNSDYPVVAQLGNGATYRIGFGFNAGTFKIISNAETAGNGKAYTPGAWYLVTLIWDGSKMNLYEDGVFDYSVVPSGSLWQSANGLLIGTDGGGVTYLNGVVDDVRVYDKALSLREMQQLYHLGRSEHGVTSVAPLAKGLVGSWTFNGPTLNDTTASDASGNGNNGTIVGAPTPVIGRMGQALSFNGTNQYINLGTPASLNMGYQSWSASAWVKTTNTSTNVGVVDKSAYTTQAGRWGITLNAGGGSDVRCLFDPTATTPVTVDGPSISDGSWHLVTCTWSRNGNATLYEDGVPQASASIASYANVDMSTNDQACIAAYQDANGLCSNAGIPYFSGSIDGVRLYNYALSATEVKQLYTMGK